MTDLAYAFTLYFVTLGPLKTIPAFFLVTRGADRRTTTVLAVRSAAVATAIVLFVALVASGTLVTWRVSTDAVAIAGGLVLLMSAIRALTSFHLAGEPVPTTGPAAAINLRGMDGPVLSPLAIPSIVTPIGIVVVLYFSGLALGDPALQGRHVGLLLAIMGVNLIAMLCARPIMRAVGLPVLQVIGWVFSALQAGLAVEVLIGAARRLVLVVAVLAVAGSADAQELDPRAFAPAPIGTTIVLAGAGGSKGSILFDPSVGVADVAADLHIVTTGFGYTFGLAGRQARVLAVFPFASGSVAGAVGGHEERQSLRGLADPRIKASIGVRGAPALRAAEFAVAPQGTAIGASVTVMPPWGQYRSAQLVNLGYNRWAFKPELGVTHPVGRWTLEAATGVWLFTTNDASYSGRLRKKQAPMGSVQGHVSYAFGNRIWVGVAGTWFGGGETRVEGVLNPDEQRNTRFGGTLSIPLGRSQSMKIVYSTGASTRRGTDFDSFSVNWQLARY